MSVDLFSLHDNQFMFLRAGVTDALWILQLHTVLMT